MRIYGLSGKKQCGKNTVANIAFEMLSPGRIKVKSIGLADALKFFCQDYLGIPEKNLWGNEFEKNKWVEKWSIFAEDIRQKYDKNAEDSISGREILQVVGTDVFRKSFGDDFWVRTLKRHLDKTNADVVFITDIRFPNEKKAVEEWGGKNIRIYRAVKRQEGIDHISETAMDKVPDEEFDYVIYGDCNRTMKRLKRSVVVILHHEGLFQEGDFGIS